jgi:hypothetical protein
MDSGVAASLWRQPFPGSDPRVVAVGQVVAATPQPEVVVGGSGGYVQAFDGATGAVVGSGQLDGSVSDVALVDVDADPDLEVVAANDSIDPGGTVAAFDADGTLLWTVPTPGAANDLAVGDLDGDGRDDMVAAGGWAENPPEGDAPGFVLALHPGTTAVQRWQADLDGARQRCGGGDGVREAHRGRGPGRGGLGARLRRPGAGSVVVPHRRAGWRTWRGPTWTAAGSPR